MSVDAARVSTTIPRRGSVGWFVAIEAMCLAGFGFCLWQDNQAAAFAFLLGPFQVLAFVVMAHDDYLPLLYFAALLPATALELLPYWYASAVLYAGTVGMLLLLRTTDSALSGSTSVTGRLLSAECLPLLVLAVWIVAATGGAFVQGWGSSDLLRQTFIGLEMILVVWVFATVPRSLRQVRVLVYLLATGYVLVCFLLPFFSTHMRGGFLGKTIVTSHGLVNLNAVATHLGVASVALTGLALDARKTLVRAFVLLAVVILLAGLLFTKSRAAWLAVGVAFLYIFGRTRSLRLLLSAGVLTIGLLASNLFRTTVSARLQATTTQDPSLWGRFLLWRSAWDVYRHNCLLVVGLLNFRFVKYFYGYPLPRTFALPYNAHNLFLEFLADLGVVGLAAFLWLTAGAFLRLDKVARRPSSGARGLAIGLNAAIIVYAVQGLLDCILWQHGAFVLLGVILGLAMCVRRLNEE